MSASHRQRPPRDIGRVASVSSSLGSSQYREGGLLRTSTMSTVSGSVRWTSESARSSFQDQLHEMAIDAGIPLDLPRPLLSLPQQRTTPVHDSDKVAADQFLMSLRPKRVLLGKSLKGFARDEVLFALDKAIESKKSLLIVEALLQLAGTNTGDSAIFSTDKKSLAVPTLESVFKRAEYLGSLAVWKLFLGRVTHRALDASLSTVLKDRPNDVDRIKALLEYGANPELCQDRILDLIAIGSEETVELLLLSPLLNNVEFLSHGLVKAARCSSLRNVCMLLLRGANTNFSRAGKYFRGSFAPSYFLSPFSKITHILNVCEDLRSLLDLLYPPQSNLKNQANFYTEALKTALSEKIYAHALAIVTITKNPISTSNLDDAIGLITTWTQECQKPCLKMLVYAGASGPRTSKIIAPFIVAHDEDVISNLIECPAFLHSTFPAPTLFQFAIDGKNYALALDVLRSSANRSSADYAITGAHLQLVKGHAENPESCAEIISELLQLNAPGDLASQMLVDCCAVERIGSQNAMPLIDLLIKLGAKVSYSDGAALFSAIEASYPEAVAALTTTKPTKKVLGFAVSHTNSCLGDDNPAKLEILSMLLDAGVSGQLIDQELISAIDKTRYCLEKVNILLRGASLDYSEGRALVRAVELERFDVLEVMLAKKTPQYLVSISVWKQIRKLFALAHSEDGHLPYDLLFMLKVFELLHASLEQSTPLHELLLEATQCTSKNAAFTLSRLFLRWGASPNHALGSPLQASVRRSDTRTLTALLGVEVSKTSLKYAFQEALLLDRNLRYQVLPMIVSAGLEKTSLDAALPQILKEEPYDKRAIHLMVNAGARLHSAFGENLVPPSVNLDFQIVGQLLSSVTDKDNILLPLRAVLTSHPEWCNPETKVLPIVKILVANCARGSWADDYFIKCIRLRDRHSAHIFQAHLTSDGVYSDALRDLLTTDATNLCRDKFLTSQYLLSYGARDHAIDAAFLCAAKNLDLEWIGGHYPYLSDHSTAVSAFHIVMNNQGESTGSQANKSTILQYFLERGLRGPAVDKYFLDAASRADLTTMGRFQDFISSKDTFSQSLVYLAQQSDLLTSEDGLAAAKILMTRGVSSVSAKEAAKAVAKAHSLAGVALLVGMSQTKEVVHAAYEGFLNQPEPLARAVDREIAIHLLQHGLADEDANELAKLAASMNDIDILKAMGPLKNYKDLYDSAASAININGDLTFLGYLLSRGISVPAIYKLIENAAFQLNVSALRMLLSVSDEAGVEKAFSSLTVDTERWTSPRGLEIVAFLLQQGAKGISVEDAAAHVARTSNSKALGVFLTNPGAEKTIPAAFKVLFRDKSGHMSSEQLLIVSSLVKHGVSSELLATAAIEMTKSLDVEGLKVLSCSSRFRQIADGVMREFLRHDDLWRSSDGLRITDFLLNEGVTIEVLGIVVSVAAASLDVDVLKSIIRDDSPSTVITCGFTSMTALGENWLCSEGLRVATYLLGRKPSQPSINKAFVQATQYLHFDAVRLLRPYIKEASVFNDALHKAVSTTPDWVSTLHIIQLLLDSGVEGDAVEFAFIEGARALHLDSIKLLSPQVLRPEIYTMAFSAATNGSLKWLYFLPIVGFLLEHGAKGTPIEAAYVAAALALDFQAITLLNSSVVEMETRREAFHAMISNQAWLSPEYLDIVEHLCIDGISSKDVETAIISAVQVLNASVVELLSRKADKDMISTAFAAAAANASDLWASIDGSKVMLILAQNGARGEVVEEALVTCVGLRRLEIVTALVENIGQSIGQNSQSAVSRALDALLAIEGEDPFGPETLGILRILISKGANGECAKEALVKAACFGNRTAVEILAPIVTDPQVYSKALNSMTSPGSVWGNESPRLVGILLAHGASGEGVHHALISAITHIIDGTSSEALLDLLLTHHADVNFQHGKALQLAAQYARFDLFEKLLLANPDGHTLYTTLKAALCHGLGEETVFRLFKYVTGSESVRAIPDINNDSEVGLPLLFYALNNYPASARLTREICGLHADLSCTILWETKENEYDDLHSDRLPPLFIALAKDCSDKVIDILLTFGANVHFTPVQSRTSALMLAAAKSRASVVSTLLDHGASVYQKDARDRTPLCYASRSGDLSSMTFILKKNPPRNDGSLHEAARELHASAVRLLIESNHDINFPSSRHGGRSPLCELCCACKASRNPIGLQNTLTELNQAKAEPLRRSRGRTAIFMAMENANPVPVVTALIEACLWKDLDDPQNVYEEGDYFYSPTMYIKKGVIRQTEVVSREILSKLQDFGATDKYYAKERMAQPKDAVGMPQRILEFDHKKWIRSSRLEEEAQDFERKLKRQEQEMANRQILSQRQHLMVLEQRENLGQQQSAHVLDTHLLGMKLRDREHAMGLSHQEEAYDHRLGEMSAGNILRMNMEAARHATKFSIEKEKWEARLYRESQARELDIGYLGKEQGVRYTGLEAQQNLRLEGISSELELKRQQQADELQYRESKSGVDRTELDHRLQHTNMLHDGRVQMMQDMGAIDLETRRNRNLLEHQNRESQKHHQFATDQGLINTQIAMNQQEYVHNQKTLDTRWIQGQIDMGTRAGMGQIERDDLCDTIQILQQDRGHQLDTENMMGQIQNQNMLGKLSMEYNHLKGTNHEALGFQQATDQQKLGYQQAADHQILSTMDTVGKIQSSALSDRNQLNLDYKHQGGNIQLGQQTTAKKIELDHEQQVGDLLLGQQLQKKTLELNFEQRRLGLQQVGNIMDLQRQRIEHQTRLEDYRAQDYLNTRTVKGAFVMGQVRKEGDAYMDANKEQELIILDERRFKQIDG